MELPQPSQQQVNVLLQLENYNVIVDSVAGSGKTTCNLHIAKKFNKLNILLLTYNAKLKLETRNKIKILGLKNMETHSYHSFCVKYYDKKCYTDTNIRNILRCSKKNIKKLNYDIIILDEAQDITPLYFEIICKIYNDNNVNAKICILGDRNQSIYSFNNADERFIIYANKLFNFNNFDWQMCNLSESFRITNEMALFINNCMLNYNRIVSKKITRNKPRYIICDCFTNTIRSKTFMEIKYYLNMGYSYDDIFILAPSIKGSGKSPVRRLANILSDHNIPIYVPISNEEKLDEDILKGKIVFSSFHQIKGLERKIIIIFNFDNSYFKFFNKDVNPKICPNVFYVASTRALEHLTLFHHYQNDYLPFINKKQLDNYCNIEYNKKLCILKYNSVKNIDTAVTDIIKHLPQEVIDKCMEYLKIKNLIKSSIKINIPIKTEQKYGYESVCEITGTAIPSYFEYKLKGKMSIFDRLLKNNFEMNIKNINNNDNSKLLIDIDSDNEYNKSNKLLIDKDNTSSESEYSSDNSLSDSDYSESEYSSDNDIKDNTINLKNIKESELLYIANKWNSFTSRYIYKLNQIYDYNWLSNNNLYKCLKRLQRLNISKNSIFESERKMENRKELLNRKIIGYIDCIDGNKVYEFKCVSQLEPEHYLQLAIYMYLNEINKNYKKSIIKGDEYQYNYNNKNYSGIITKIFNNGNINIRNFETRKVDKITKNNIIEKSEKENTNYYLYNILTDELNQITCEFENLTKMIKFLIYSKYNSSKKIADNLFISNMKKIHKYNK